MSWKKYFDEPLPIDGNYLFYSNKLRSRPDDLFIDDILKDWYYEYDILESHHGFIQWIFPELKRLGSNPLAKALNKVRVMILRSSGK